MIELSQPGRFNPLSPEHPSARMGTPCGVCAEPMRVGDVPALIENEAPDAGHDGMTREALICHESCVFPG